MGEVPFELGKGWILLLEMVVALGAVIKVQQNGFSREMINKPQLCTEDSEWFNLAEVLHIL